MEKDKNMTDDTLEALVRLGEDADSAWLREPEAAYGWKRSRGEYTIDDYYALPDDRRVELIDGTFYDMAAPTITHQIISGRLFHALDQYIEEKGGDCVASLAPCDVQPDSKDDRWLFQPDVLVVCDRDKIRDDRLIVGAPDFVAEIASPSTGKKDRTVKLRKYRETGTREYWVIDPATKMVEVYIFKSVEMSVLPRVYRFHETVPVDIFHGDCKVDFAKITRRIS